MAVAPFPIWAALAVGVALVWIAGSNLEGVPFPARLAMALAVLLGANWMAFRGLTTPGRGQVGEAWLVIATFAVAAAGAVISQRYHLGGDGAELWAAWALAAGTMAWLARSTALGLVAAAALCGAVAATPPEHSWPLPWAFALGLAPLAYVLRSPALLATSGLGLGLAMLSVASNDQFMVLAMVITLPLGLLGWVAWHPTAWPGTRVDLATTRLLAACLTVGTLVLAAGGVQLSGDVSATTLPVAATVGAGGFACVLAWALADRRLADRALHRAMGAAAVVTAVVAIGTEPWLDALLANAAIASVGMMTAREGLVLRESGSTFVGFGVIFMLLLMADASVDPTPGGRAFIFVIMGGLAVATTWWLASRDGRRARPGGVVTKGADA